MAMSHTGHNHPATPAGRAACRKAMKAGLVDIQGPISAEADAAADRVARRFSEAFQAAKAKCTIDATHCEQCGQVDPGHHEGYTACCNELLAYGSSDCRNHHA